MRTREIPESSIAGVNLINRLTCRATSEISVGQSHPSIAKYAIYDRTSRSNTYVNVLKRFIPRSFTRTYIYTRYVHDIDRSLIVLSFHFSARGWTVCVSTMGVTRD